MQDSVFGLRLIRGLGAGLLGHVISLIARVLLPPLFLQAWGVEVYGEWLVLTAMAAYLAFSDFGGGPYVVNRMTQEFAVGDLKALRKTLQTSIALFTLLPAVVFILFAAAMLVVPIRDVLGLGTFTEGAAKFVAILLALQIAISLPQGLILGIFRAVGQLPRGVMLANGLQLLQLVIVGACLTWDVGPEWISVYQLAPFVIVGFVAAWDLDHRFPALGLYRVKEADTQLARTFLKPSMHFFSIQIALALSVQGVILVAGLTLGAAQVVSFATVRTLCNAMKSVFSLVSTTAWPELTRLDSLREIDSLASLFRAVLRTTMLGATLTVFLLHNYGEQIYQTWLAGTVVYEKHLMILFLLFLLQQVFWNTCGNFLMAVNAHYALSGVMIVSSILSIGLAWAGAKLDGTEGLVLGMTMADVILPLWLVPFLMTRHNNAFTFGFFVVELIPPCVVIAAMLLYPPVAFVLLAFLISWWWAAAKKIFRSQFGDQKIT